MDFQLIICLDQKKEYNKQVMDIVELLDDEIKIKKHRSDYDEGILSIDVELNDLEDIMLLPSLLDDDIVIYGPDSDVLITRGDMNELGFN